MNRMSDITTPSWYFWDFYLFGVWGAETQLWQTSLSQILWLYPLRWLGTVMHATALKWKQLDKPLRKQKSIDVLMYVWFMGTGICQDCRMSVCIHDLHSKFHVKQCIFVCVPCVYIVFSFSCILCGLPHFKPSQGSQIFSYMFLL